MHPHLAGGHTEGLVAEHVACEDVDQAEYASQNAGGDNDAPVCSTERVLGRGLLVEITQNGDSKEDHDHTQRYEAGIGR